MERHLVILDEERRRRRQDPAAVQRGGARLTDRVEVVATVPACSRRRRDGVEQIPGDSLERRAGEGRQPDERDQDRRRARAGPGGGADRDRRRDVHPVGRRLRTRRDAARRLLLQALPRRVQARGRRLVRDAAAQEPRRALDALRDAPVQARGDRRGRAPRRRGRGVRGRGSSVHSARRRTTSSESCSSPSRCSSPV